MPIDCIDCGDEVELTRPGSRICHQCSLTRDVKALKQKQHREGQIYQPYAKGPYQPIPTDDPQKQREYVKGHIQKPRGD